MFVVRKGASDDGGVMSPAIPEEGSTTLSLPWSKWKFSNSCDPHVIHGLLTT